MIKYTDSDKSLQIPRNLGNYPQSSVTGGTTPEEVQRMIDASLEDYTLTDDFATVNGRPITEGGNIEISGGTPTQVTVTQVVTGGTKIATIGVDGTETDLYAPASGGGVTPQDVQDAIDSALTPYETAQQADAKYAEKPLTAVIYHNGSEDDPFTQADLAQLQALADALSGLTSGDTIPVAYIDLMDENGLYYRFILTYGEGENWAFIAPDTDGYTSCFTLITEDVSASSYYAGQGWDDAIAGYVENEVQPQIDTLTGNTADLQSQIDALTAQTADFETRISDLEALTGDTGNVVVLDINESSLYSKIDVAINDGKTVILKGPYDYEYQGEIVYLFYSDEPSAYRFRGVKAVASGQVNTFTVTVYENGTFDGTYVNNGTRYISVWGGVRNYTLPTASANALGGVKVGSGLTIDQNGVLSATGGGGSSIDVYDIAEIKNMTSAERSAVASEISTRLANGDSNFIVIGWYYYNGRDIPYAFPCAVTNLDSNNLDVKMSAIFANYMGGRVVYTYNMSNNSEDVSDLINIGDNYVSIDPTDGSYSSGDIYGFLRGFGEGPTSSYAQSKYPIRFGNDNQNGCTIEWYEWDANNDWCYFGAKYRYSGQTYECIWRANYQSQMEVVSRNKYYSMWTGSQAEYNALQTYDSSTIYHIDQN